VLLKFLSRKNLEQPSQFSQKKLIISLLWMFIAWGGGGLILFTLAQAITPINWSLIPLMIGIWGAAGAVSLTIGIGIQGMGIREVTLGALLSLIMPPITAIVVAIAFRLVLTVGEFLWVAFFAWITKVKGDGHS
jgi:hypothetical protein